MSELAVNDPEVVEAVREAFERYERALVNNDVAVMTSLFATGPSIIRFGVADIQRGADDLAAWRSRQPPLPPGRRLSETAITTYGESVGVVTTLFSYPGREIVGRQSQTWLRLGERWRIVHAHVSEVAAGD